MGDAIQHEGGREHDYEVEVELAETDECRHAEEVFPQTGSREMKRGKRSSRPLSVGM